MSHILLGVSASVAAYKACDLASRLTQAGHSVRAILTPRAAELVSLQLFEAVTGEPRGGPEVGLSLEHAPGGDRAGQDRGLGVVGPGELVEGALSSERSQVGAQGLVGLLPGSCCGGERLCERHTHPDRLRSLARKKGCPDHDCKKLRARARVQ